MDDYPFRLGDFCRLSSSGIHLCFIRSKPLAKTGAFQMNQTPPLPLYASLLPKGRRKKFSADQMLKRLEKKYPDLVAQQIRKGIWAAPQNSIQEFKVKLRVVDVKVQFVLFDIPDPGGDFCIYIEDFTPDDAPSVVKASCDVADALGFSIDINTALTWGINVWAMRDTTPKAAAIAQSYEGKIKLTRLPLKTWVTACHRASELWCAEGFSVRPSLKKKMLKTYGGAKGVAETILRDVAAFGKINSWFESRTGACAENTAVLRMPPWTVTVCFSSVNNGVLRV